MEVSFWNDSCCQLLRFPVARNSHKSFFHMLNYLFSIVFYTLCGPKVDLFIAYGPSVATVVPKHLGLTTLWLLCI